MRLVIAGYDVTAYIKTLKWAGDIDTCARTLDVDLSRGVLPEYGDTVRLYDGSTLLLEGIVMFAERNWTGVTMESTDLGVYLANNKTYKEYKGTPQAIAAQVCAEFSVPVKSLAAAGETTKVTSTGNLTAFGVLSKAYNPNKQEYAIGYDGGLIIERLGSQVVARLEYEISEASNSTSIKKMVNKVVIVKRGKKLSEVGNTADQGQCGTFQDTYTSQKGKTDAAEAKKLLKSIERAGSLSAIGNSLCRAGKAVQLVDEKSGLSGVYAIRSDTHTWKDGAHSMKLELYFANE
jgi:hypothetical protein